MRLTILGGGGFRVPLVYGALLTDHAEGRVTEVVLHDLDDRRLYAVARVLADQASTVANAPTVTATTDLDEALRGADFVFSAIRVGGLEGRANDERVALAEGVLGQETVGAGGIAYGLRTVPVAVDIARRVARLAPDAWVINFTNPAGLVTEAMSRHLGDRVIGICDSPVGLGRRIARVLGANPREAFIDYVGLNHLGWVRGLRVAGRDELPRLLADSDLLGSFEEGKLFGVDWLRSLGAIPNEYLHYYYFNRETVRAYQQAEKTRGAFLRDQQARFYEEMRRPDAAALTAWDRTRAEREATYMAENRETAGAGERDADDLSGGYEKVALALMRAIARDERTTLILNVRNQGALSVLDADAVIEVPCLVDANGAHPVAVAPLPGHATG
ncbi:6-phospho-beta-glucosidase, partial [Streptomyces bobili]|uniref:6-phospho-beta-glucosidase n=1 Tax=Streptomyces bobili TaxID=67280 RepID=UPI003421CA9C